MVNDPVPAAVPGQAAASSSTAPGDVWAAVAGFVGALGAGIAFAEAQTRLAASFLLGFDSYWLTTAPTWLRLLPAIYVAVMVLVAVLGRRWGWSVAAGALAVYLVLIEARSTVSFGSDVFLLVVAVTTAAALGGALAAFGVAARSSRIAVGAGLAVGMAGGHLLVLSSVYAYVMDPTRPPGGSDRLAIGTPLALCAVAALIWLLRGTGANARGTEVSTPVAGEPRPGPRWWMTPTVAVAVAFVAIGACIAMLAFLDNLSRGGSSQRRLDTVDTLYQVGSLGIAVVAGIALATYAYRRGGSVLARWVLVGLATGTAVHFTALTSGPLWPGLNSVPATFAAAGAVAVVGALAGAGLSRFAAVPWDGLGLAVIAIAVVLRSPQGREEFVDRGTSIRVLILFLVGLVLAVSLTSLGRQTSLRDIGGPGEVAALVGLSFAAAIVASTVIFPSSMLANLYGETGLAPAIAVGIATVGVFALYGLGRLARSVRHAIEAEARRELT